MAVSPPQAGQSTIRQQAKSAKGAARTFQRIRNRFAPHPVLRVFPKSAKGAARTFQRIRNRFAPHPVLRVFPKSQQGFVLIVTAISMTLLLGLAALGIDIGRMYVIRAELQAFTDAAALSAALELNGTDSGLARARDGAGRLATGPHAMRWDMGTQPIANIATSFSSDGANWQEQPKQAYDLRFVRVIATESAPVIFMRIFQPLTSATVAAASVAAKTEMSARLIQ